MKGLFDLFMEAANVPDAEMSLIEKAIGGAILEKVRGIHSLPSQIYKAHGGSDGSISDKVLSKIDELWPTTDSTTIIEAFEKDVAPKGKTFSEVYPDIPSHELSLIERTLGRGILDKMRGKKTTPVSIYQDLGGSDPETQKVFSNLGKRWNKKDPNKALDKLSQ